LTESHKQPSNMDKKERKEKQDQLAEKNLAEFKKSLPIDQNTFAKLIDFLDAELGEKGCNRTILLTKTFLEKHGVSNVADVIEWLTENGGGCDCEVFASFEDLFEEPNPPTRKPLAINQLKKQKITSLQTEAGFSIDNIPAPWILTETLLGDEKTHHFQLGKSTNCIAHLATDFPITQWENDSFWTDCWVNETGLDDELEGLTVERMEWENYLVVLVKTKKWTPVKVWCARKSTNAWFLKMTTEQSRQKGDIKELEKLTSHIKAE
jgi:hypothetical protein